MNSEHDTFAAIIDSLRTAEANTTLLAGLQADRRDVWLTVAGNIKRVREAILDVAMKGQVPQ